MPSVRILPTRKIQNMGPRKLWCASGMGMEGAHTFLEGGNLGGKYGRRVGQDNLAGDSATISLLVIIFKIKRKM